MALKNYARVGCICTYAYVGERRVHWPLFFQEAVESKRLGLLTANYLRFVALKSDYNIFACQSDRCNTFCTIKKMSKKGKAANDADW